MKRLVLLSSISLLSLSAISGVIHAEPETKEPIKFPAGYENFIAEYNSLLKKYPKAAERFMLRDKPSTKMRTCCAWDTGGTPTTPYGELGCSMVCEPPVLQ